MIFSPLKIYHIFRTVEGKHT